MSEQPFLPGVPVLVPAEKCTNRFDECRQRAASGFGGHHRTGPVFAGFPIVEWVCCDGFPNRAELNPWAIK